MYVDVIHSVKRPAAALGSALLLNVSLREEGKDCYSWGGKLSPARVWNASPVCKEKAALTRFVGERSWNAERAEVPLFGESAKRWCLLFSYLSPFSSFLRLLATTLVSCIKKSSSKSLALAKPGFGQAWAKMIANPKEGMTRANLQHQNSPQFLLSQG